MPAAAQVSLPWDTVRMEQRGWRVTWGRGKRGQREAGSSISLFLTAARCSFSSHRHGKAALKQTQCPQLAGAGAGQGRGAPALPSQGRQQTPWGRNVSKCSSSKCQMLPVYSLTEFSTLNEKNLYQIKKMSHVNGSCMRTLIGQRLPLLAHPPESKGDH